VVIEGEVLVVSPLTTEGIINGGNVLQPAERSAVTVFQVVQHLRHQVGGHPVGAHVGGTNILAHPAIEGRLQLTLETEGRKGLPGGRGAPHII